jgi:ubiquinone/menaquinone biosynthesis C-methylase UbiE
MQFWGGEVMNKIAFIRGDVRNLSFDDSYFDVVVNTEVLEHLPGYLQDDEKAIREFNRVLKNKGQLFVEFPLNLHFYLHLIPFSRPTLKGSSIRDWQRKLLVSNTFREKIMRELLLTYNFQITTKKYIRVIPAGLIERLQILSTLDHYLELTPFLNNLSREVIFACQKG